MADSENRQGEEALTRLMHATLTEQRRARRWGIFFKSLLFLYLFALLLMVVVPQSGDGLKAGPHTALVEIRGIISDSSDASADTIVTGLRNALEDEQTRGVILRINSPGGSPVQAGYVYDEIIRLRTLHPGIPIYTVVSDICASGGYYIASATDAIYADKASIVGSVGVLMNSFGFVEAMEKLGIERRLLTAGENKAFLDPFSPQEEAHVTHARQMLDTIHQQFIEAVKAGRGERLADDERLFTGLVWSGERSVALGLVDELGSAGYVAREVVGAERIVDFTVRPRYFERLVSRLGSAIGGSVSTALGLNGDELR